jgi:choline dehydrogenase-like flavoprotein
LKRIFTKRIQQLFGQELLVYVQSEQIPIVESRITISKNDKLKNGLNKVLVHWDWSGKETYAIHAMIIELNKYLIKENIGKIVLDKRIMNKDPEILKIYKDTSHHCGGMRMSNSDNCGVVDSQCKVWRTDNVWVAGSAVFPSSGYANSTLTALALAERIVKKSILS